MYQENVTALKKDAPIGVFDSGIGGLTVAREIMRQIPNEKIIYFGDTARMPYGSKSKETVTRFSKQIVRFLETFQVKTIVVACNTASAYALDELEKELSAEFDIEKRAELAVQMQQTVLDDHAFVFCSFLKMSMISKANVTGYESHACDYYQVTADLDIN